MTSAERLQLIGLFTLADELNRQLDSIVLAAEALTGDEHGGHTMDCVHDAWGAPPQMRVDSLCERLKLTAGGPRP